MKYKPLDFDNFRQKKKVVNIVNGHCCYGKNNFYHITTLVSHVK